MAVFQKTPWRWILGILGVTCLFLMATLGILLKYPFPQPTRTPEPSTLFQEGHDWGSCQERWIGYLCNCYFVSRDSKTWEESRNFCALHNSTLLHMNNRDELHFMKSNAYFYWIGVRYSKEHKDWRWLNGSSFPQDQFTFFEVPNKENCITYNAANSILDNNCTHKYRYICKQQLI